MLASWNDSPARAEILDFVARAVESVPPPERVAVFDNDGTLWCERPDYPQAEFLFAELGERPQDLGTIARAALTRHAGLTVDEYGAAVARWFAAARHPRFGVAYDALIYAPMVELLDLLRANGFRVFIVTGGGVEFVRAVSERIYGVPPDDVVGSAVQVRVARRDGRVVLVREPKLLGSPNEGEPKAVNIQAHIGRRPILAAGNSAGDREMLEYAHGGDRPSLCLVINHDDPEREYVYAGAALTNPNAEPLTNTASAYGWTTVSMRDDWKRIFV